MKNNKIIVLISFLFLTVSFSQKAELITQQVDVENAIRGKVESTINKFLDNSQYIAIVNARLEFKPLSMGAIEKTESNFQDQTTSPYTLIPGLDMPSIPTKQKIYQPELNNSSFQYSTEKYFLYSLDITIYVDEKVSTGSLQQNIKTLIMKNIPEIADCQDCVKFETIDFLSQNKKSSRYEELLKQIELLEQDRRDAEKTLQDWRFDQLEVQLTTSEDARSEWEKQARDREEQRLAEDTKRLEKLQNIEKKYREKQDSLYILTSIKLDEALRGRIASEENTKKELLGLIKMQIQGEEISGEDISDGTRSDLYTKKPSMGGTTLSSQMWLMITVVTILVLILVIILTRNKSPIYLKPKNQNNGNNNNNDTKSGSNIPFTETQANENTEVQRSELQSLRQSAVSMSVSEKEGATQIVQDWLSDGTSNEDTKEEELDQENKEK